LLAFDRGGTEKWRTEVGFSRSTPAIGDDGTIYVMTTHDGLKAINKDGTLKWTSDDNRGEAPLAIGKGGNLFFGEGNDGFVCLSKEGERVWVDDQTSYFVKAIPAIRGNGNVVIGHEEYRFITEYDANGNTVWEALSSGLINSATVMASDGTVYVCGYTFPGGHVEAFDKQGERLWHHELDEWPDGSACIGPDGTIYVQARDDKIHAIDPDGDEKWSVNIGRYGWGNVVVSNDGVVFVGNVDGNMTAIKDGKISWVFKAGDNIYSTPAMDKQGILYFGCDDGKLYAVGKDRTLTDTVSDYMLYIVVFIVLAVVGVAIFVRLNKGKGVRTKERLVAAPQEEEARSYDDLYGGHQDHSYRDQERPGQLPPGP
jgi:outer membrane protein assembly factor BamB